jgi:hypothetical protein
MERREEGREGGGEGEGEREESTIAVSVHSIRDRFIDCHPEFYAIAKIIE